MTLRVKISHANPGYPVRALVQARGASGTPCGFPTVVGDGQTAELYVHAGQTLKISEDGHQGIDTEEAGRRAYEVYVGAVGGTAANGTTLPEWAHLGPLQKAGWRAVAEALL